MKFKKSLITIAGCAAMLGSSFVYAEDARWNGKQSYEYVSPADGAPGGAGEPGVRTHHMLEQRIEFIKGLDLSKAQQNEIAKLRANNAEGNEKTIQNLQKCSAELRQLMMNPESAKQSEVNEKIDACAMARADLQKSKAKVRHIIYTQILNKEQQKQVMDMLKKKMAEENTEGRGPRGMMPHGLNHAPMPVPAEPISETDDMAPA